ncbi:MAG: hypothetical protein IT364_01545 [Candidatus Hydrogenedentes bacterium]|nr:hypothetical protein [Candidatus Hydrogenedentota bacterium]
MLDILVVLAVGLTLVWLLAGPLSATPVPTEVSLLIVVFFVAGTFQIIVWMGAGGLTIGMVIANAIVTLDVVLAVTLARFFCRKRYTPGRFKGAAGVCAIALGQLALPVFVFLAVLQASMLDDAAMVLTFMGGAFFMLLAVGLVLGMLLWVYLALAYRSAALRERFEHMVQLHAEPCLTPTNVVTGASPVERGAV